MIRSINKNWPPSLVTLAVICSGAFSSCNTHKDRVHVEYEAGALHYTIPDGYFHEDNLIFLHLHSVDENGKNVTSQKDFLLPDRHMHCSILRSECSVQQNIPDTSTFDMLITGIYSIKCNSRLTQLSWNKKGWSEFNLHGR